jgi:histone acetyltransferase (RNA polymerase elongator complex component)
MIVPVFLPHAGCGQRCTYCNQDIITNNVKGVSTGSRIARLLQPIRDPVEVALYGGNMLGLGPEELEGLLSLFDPYRRRISHLRISAKPGPVSKETIAVLKEHGVTVVELGIPTVNDAILRALGRGHTARDFFESFRLLVGEGFEVGMQVMVGLPGEAFADLCETVSAVTTLAPCFIRIYPLVVIEDTGLFEAFAKGAYVPDTLEAAVTKASFVYASAWSHGVRTIKMGLTDNDVIKERIAAGPFHPAFGYLVKSEAFRLAVSRVCEAKGARGRVTVSVSPHDVAHIVGPGRANVHRFREEGIAIDWATDPALDEGFFRVNGIGKEAEGSLADSLAMIPS